MKKKLVVLLMLVMLFVPLLYGCGGGLKGKPSAGANVYGNGGLAVRTDGYVYFVNGFVSKNDKYKNNKSGKVYKSAIYRVKTGVDGALEHNEETGNTIGAERVIGKVAGYENTGLFIIGKYLYYTSPSVRVNKNGTMLVNNIDVYRIGLNGKNNKKLFSVANYDEVKGSFEVYEVKGSAYITVYNGSNTLVVYKGTKKVFGTSECESVVMPHFNERIKKDIYGVSVDPVSAAEQTVYYTTEGGKELRCYVPGKGAELIKEFTAADAVALTKAVNGRLYYIQNEYLKSNSIFDEYFKSGTKEAPASLNDIYFFAPEGGNTRADFIYVQEGKISIKGITRDTIIYDGPVDTVFCIVDDRIIFSQEGRLYSIDKFGQNKLQITEQEDTIKLESKRYVTSDGQYLYFFKQHTNLAGTSFYLQRADLQNQQPGETHVTYQKAELSKKLEADYPDPEEEDEDRFEGEEND